MDAEQQLLLAARAATAAAENDRHQLDNQFAETMTRLELADKEYR